MKAKLLAVGLLAGLGVAACGGSDSNDSPVKTLKSVDFTETPVPATADEMAKAYTKSAVKLTYSDGTVVDKPLTYQTLFSVKDKISEVKGQTSGGPALQL